MATPIQLTIGTGQRIGIRYTEQPSEEGSEVNEECSLVVTFEMEPGERLLQVVSDKAGEVEQAHALAQSRIRSARVERRSVADTAHAAIRRGAAQTPSPSKECPITGPQRIALQDRFRQAQYSEANIVEHLTARFNKARIEDLSQRQAADLLKEMQPIAEAAQVSSQGKYPHPETERRPGSNGYHTPIRRQRK